MSEYRDRGYREREYPPRSSGDKSLWIVLGVVGGIVLVVLVVCGGLIALFVYGMQQAGQSLQRTVEQVSKEVEKENERQQRRSREQEAARKEADTFLADIRRNNLEQAYASTTDGFKRRFSSEELAAFIDKNPQLRKLLNVTMDMDPHGAQPEAPIQFSLVDTSGFSPALKLTVTKEADSWKVDRLEQP